MTTSELGVCALMYDNMLTTVANVGAQEPFLVQELDVDAAAIQ